MVWLNPDEFAVAWQEGSPNSSDDIEMRLFGLWLAASGAADRRHSGECAGLPESKTAPTMAALRMGVRDRLGGPFGGFSGVGMTTRSSSRHSMPVATGSAGDHGEHHHLAYAIAALDRGTAGWTHVVTWTDDSQTRRRYVRQRHPHADS